MVIKFVKKALSLPVIVKDEQNRFELIRKTAVEQHRKSDMDGARRRARQTKEDNRLI